MARVNDDDVDRIQSLKSGIFCIALMRFLYILYYLLLFSMHHVWSYGLWEYILEVMLVVPIIPDVFYMLFLVTAAANEFPRFLTVCISACLLIATYNLNVSMMGFLFYVRKATKPVHYFISLLFALLGLTFVGCCYWPRYSHHLLFKKAPNEKTCCVILM